MSLKFRAAKGKRIKRSRFDGATTFDKYWYCDELGKWIHYDDMVNYTSMNFGCSSHAKCRSVRAFRRFLRKHSKYLPRGVKFILVSRYVGYDVIGVTK